MANIPTVDDLKRKAEETRQAAQLFTSPELRAKMLEVAAEFERLARRAEEFEERARIGANNAGSLEKWLG